MNMIVTYAAATRRDERQAAQISELQEALAAAQASIGDKAAASDLAVLESRVLSAESVGLSQGADLADLRDDMDLIGASLAGKASAAVVSAHGAALEELREDHDAIAYDLMGKASAGSVSALSTRVTTLEGETQPLARGGTGATTAAAARTNLGAAAAADLAALTTTVGTKADAASLKALALRDTVATAHIDNAAVTNAKLANMATARFKGRVAAGTGAPEDLTAAQVKTALAIAPADVSGLQAALEDLTSRLLAAETALAALQAKVDGRTGWKIPD